MTFGSYLEKESQQGAVEPSCSWEGHGRTSCP